MPKNNKNNVNEHKNDNKINEAPATAEQIGEGKVSTEPTSAPKTQTGNRPIGGFPQNLGVNNPSRKIFGDDVLNQEKSKIPGLGYVAPVKPKEEPKEQPKASEKKSSSKGSYVESRIPGWNNAPQNQPSPIVTQPLTEEERLKQHLSMQEHYLENLQNQRGGSAYDITQRKINIQATEKEIEALKLKLGLITQEEIDAKQREEKLKELERNKEELRSSERALSYLKNLPEAKDDGERITRRNQIRAIEKNIERLQRLVPEAERLPINDEKEEIEENLEEEVNEEPKVEPVNRPQQNKKPTQSLGFFDMDEEEEAEPVENEANREAAVEYAPSGRNLKNDLRAAFGDDDDDEEAYEEEELPTKKDDKKNENEKLHEINVLGVNVTVEEGKVKEILTEKVGGVGQIVSEANQVFAPLPEDAPQASPKISEEELKEIMEEAADDEAFERAMAREPARAPKDEIRLEYFIPDGHYVENMVAEPAPEKDNANVNNEAEPVQEKKEDVVQEKKEEQAENKAPQVDALKNENAEAKPLDDKKIDDAHRLAVFTNNLASFNSMYKLDVKAEEFNKTITNVWSDLTSGDTQKIANGKKTLNEFFKSTLQPAIAVEKSSAYKDQRMPDLNEVIISTNDLFRSSMFAFTDLYHNPEREGFYKMTAFGGFDAKELAEIAVGDSSWKMDQRSNKAWDVQSREAKDLADKWLAEERPYETMLKEITELVGYKENGVLSNREAYAKLAAAEWMLINNEKMMVENPDDPLNPIPNWGNRYWRTLSETREALGIPKHTSMRELIQGNYEEIAKATENKSYNAKQLEERVFASEAIGVYDSYEAQMVEFATQSAAHSLVEPTKDKADELANTEEDYIRRREPVTSEDERENMKRAPKVFSNWVVERASELTIDTQREDFR